MGHSTLANMLTSQSTGCKQAHKPISVQMSHEAATVGLSSKPASGTCTTFTSKSTVAGPIRCLPLATTISKIKKTFLLHAHLAQSLRFSRHHDHGATSVLPDSIPRSASSSWLRWLCCYWVALNWGPMREHTAQSLSIQPCGCRMETCRPRQTMLCHTMTPHIVLKFAISDTIHTYNRLSVDSVCMVVGAARAMFIPLRADSWSMIVGVPELSWFLTRYFFWYERENEYLTKQSVRGDRRVEAVLWCPIFLHLDSLDLPFWAVILSNITHVTGCVPSIYTYT